MDRPIILTAKMDNHAQRFFNEKRRAHFPPDRNYLDAHITLFHKLPADQLEQIRNDLNISLGNITPMQACASYIFFMGFGSAYEIECPALTDLHASLAQHWQNWLSPQDAQKFKPHITFQNKVPADAAKAIYADEQQKFTPFDFEIIGLALYYYDGGPWEHIDDILF